ncbi:MAG: aspartate dehydrogenase [Phenylobacterium sp.]|nr:aspartate dehydrogenase [Phenylobacterium sp.]
MKRATIFGMGAIGASLAVEWQDQPPRSWALAGVCARPHQVGALRERLGPGVAVVDSLEAMQDLAPDAVVEAAGHAAARSVAAPILRSGCDLYLLSSGILADDDLLAELVQAAEAGAARIVVPAGALAGFDGLMALSRLPGAQVTYRSTKPARAWLGTPAERDFDLEHLTASTVIFRGTAREAALAFPRNANLAASVALAGAGFDRTRVELVADPLATSNLAELEARTEGSELRVQMASLPETQNPKSSAIVRTSVMAALERATAPIGLA